MHLDPTEPRVYDQCLEQWLKIKSRERPSARTLFRIQHFEVSMDVGGRWASWHHPSMPPMFVLFGVRVYPKYFPVPEICVAVNEFRIAKRVALV